MSFVRPPAVQRIILHHANGLRRILGAYDPADYELAATVEFDQALFRVGPPCVHGELVAITAKTVIYRESEGTNEARHDEKVV